MCVCVCVPLVVWVLGEATRVQDPLELELQELVGDGNPTWVLWKSGSAFSH